MDINEILSVNDKDTILEQLKQDTVLDGFTPTSYRNDATITKYIEYYKNINKQHAVDRDLSRQDYFAYIPKINDKGEVSKVQDKTTGKMVVEKESILVKRTRKHLSIPQHIIETGGAMIFGEPVDMKLVVSDEDNSDQLNDSFQEFKKTWQQYIQMDTFNLKVFKQNSIESKCAVIFQFEDKENPSPKNIVPILLCKENGDDLWVHKHDLNKDDALLRVYTKTILKDGKFIDVEFTQLFTAEKTIEWRDDDDTSQEEWPNPYNINIFVYLDQELPEYWPAIETINDQEIIYSRIADINRKIGSEQLVVQGNVASIPNSNADVKLWEARGVRDAAGNISYGDIKSFKAEGATDAQNKEIERNWDEIYRSTWTDLSKLWETIKGSGTSGYAIRVALTDMWVKRSYRGIQYQEYLNKCSKIILKMLATVDAGKGYEDMDISFKFNEVLPDDLKEKIENIGSAKSYDLIDTHGAIQLANMGNAETIYNAVKEEEKEKANLENSFSV